MKRVGMVLHATRPEAAAAASKLADALRAHDIQIVASPDDAARIGPEVADGALSDPLDLVVALGGDGTLLHAVEQLDGAATPVLGVNLGHLGFLTGLEGGDLEEAAGSLAAGRFEVEERRLVRADVNGTQRYALNDVIIEKRRAGRSIRLSVAIGGEPLVAWAADGVIVASSTGSTAYSFSVGGPVVSPRVPCLIVTPVAAHGMFGRSMIVPADEDVAIALARDAEDEAALSVDGREAEPLAPGSEVVVTLSERAARLARLDTSPFWRLLRQKFGLPEA